MVFINPSCPSGGQFYACNGTITSFAGCCTSDACNNAIVNVGGANANSDGKTITAAELAAVNQEACPAANMKSMSFNASTYGQFPDQQCSDGTSKFYTCAETSPPFMGCCKSDPCHTGSGCPAGDLVGVLLAPGSDGQTFLKAVYAPAGEATGESPLLGGQSSVATGGSGTATVPPALATATTKPTVLSIAPLIPTPSLPTAQGSTLTMKPSSTSLLSSPHSSSSSSSTSTSSARPVPLGQKSTVSKGAVAGITVSSLVLISGLAVIAFFFYRRRIPFRRKSQRLSRATFRQPSLFLPISRGSEARTVISGPLGGGPFGISRETFLTATSPTPSTSRGREWAGAAGFQGDKARAADSSPVRGGLTPTRPNRSPPGLSALSQEDLTLRNEPPGPSGLSTSITAGAADAPDIFMGPPPPIQPRSERRPPISSEMAESSASNTREAGRYYATPSSTTYTNTNRPQISKPYPQPPPQSMTSNSQLNVPGQYSMPNRVSANSISQQYLLSPHYLANNPIFGSGPSASGPNFGFPILLSGSASPMPSPEPQPIPFNRMSGGQVPQGAQFPGGVLLSTSPPLGSSPPMVFGAPPNFQSGGGGMGMGMGFGSSTIRQVPLESVPEEGGSTGLNNMSGRGTGNPARNSRNSMTIPQRRMSPLSSVQYPPPSPERGQQNVGLGLGGFGGGMPGGNNNGRGPLINYAGNPDDYMENYRGVTRGPY
jgi:hypothetical protein